MVVFQNKETGIFYAGFFVPDYGETPKDEMIDWLAGYDGWDGDDAGIVIGDYVAVPGQDAVVQDPMDSRSLMIIKKSEMDNYRVVKLGAEPPPPRPQRWKRI